MSDSSLQYDEEKAPVKTSLTKEDGTANVVAAHDGVKREGGLLGKMWAAVQYLDSFGVEVR